MSLRVLMVGTGTFALPSFRKLMNSNHEVIGLVTQPDRVGRGHHRHVNEMKQVALDAELPVFQPDNVNTDEALSTLSDFAADIFVVAAYGQILSAELLSIPRLGAINLHGSLLPKYRGAAPVQYSVLNGDKETGVTIFQIEPKLDAGPMLGVVSTEIGKKETSGQLHDRLAELSAPLTLQVLDGLESGNIERISQEPNAATKAPKIRKEQGVIDWSRTSKEIRCHVFGMQPWPLPFTFFHHPERKKSRIIILDVVELSSEDALQLKSKSPGEIAQTDDRLLVKTGNGGVEVLRLQPAGKKPMEASQFLCGTNVQGGRFSAEINQ